MGNVNETIRCVLEGFNKEMPNDIPFNAIRNAVLERTISILLNLVHHLQDQEVCLSAEEKEKAQAYRATRNQNVQFHAPSPAHGSALE